MSEIDSQQYNVAKVGFSTIQCSRLGWCSRVGYSTKVQPSRMQSDRNIDEKGPRSRADKNISTGRNEGDVDDLLRSRGR